MGLWQAEADRHYFGEGGAGMHYGSADVSVCPRPQSYSVELRLQAKGWVDPLMGQTELLSSRAFIQTRSRLQSRLSFLCGTHEQSNKTVEVASSICLSCALHPLSSGYVSWG